MIKHLVLPIIVSILLILLLEPFGFMAPMYFMTILVIASIMLCFVFILGWKERPRDEREESNMHFADRFAYLAGAIVILVGLALEGLNHEINPWLVIALIVMTLSKALAFFFRESKN